MLSLRASLAIVLSAAFVASPAFASRTHHTSFSGHSHKTHRLAKKSHRLHGQQAIEPARVTEIQQALIREHYMSGEATGKWDATHRRGDAEVPGRPGLADQVDARLTRFEEAWPGTRLLGRHQRQDCIFR